MYTAENFKSKKALREAVEAKREVRLFAPGLGSPVENGRETVEGPHYPQPHKWYAVVQVENGLVVRVIR